VRSAMTILLGSSVHSAPEAAKLPVIGEAGNLEAHIDRTGSAATVRFWLAERSVLKVADLVRGSWRRPGNAMLLPLVSPASVLSSPRPAMAG
jgi:hypothetical protein